VHDPPSIRLSDPFLGLAPGAEYTLEWAAYPFGSNCSDWFCFVNSLRCGNARFCRCFGRRFAITQRPLAKTGSGQV